MRMRTDKPYRQLTGLGSTDSARVPCDLLKIGDRFACAQQEDPSGRGQLDSPAASFKQGNPDILFQKLDLGANSRLRNMQRSRCTGETEFFCYRYKITKVTEFHGADLYGPTYSPPFPGDRPPLERNGKQSTFKPSRIIGPKENAPEFDYSRLYRKPAPRSRRLLRGFTVFHGKPFVRPSTSRTEFLIVLYFPFCVRSLVILNDRVVPRFADIMCESVREKKSLSDRELKVVLASPSHVSEGKVIKFAKKVTKHTRLSRGWSFVSASIQPRDRDRGRSIRADGSYYRPA